MPPKKNSVTDSEYIESDINMGDIEKLIKDTLKSPKVLNELAKSIAAIVVKKYEQQQNEMREKLDTLESTITEKETIIAKLEDRIQDLEQYSRRNSLRVFGIPEAPREDAQAVVVNMFKKSMGVTLNNFSLDRVHRIGKPSQGKIRPIIVKFTNYNDRATVFQKKKLLKGSKMTVFEDLTKSNMELLNAAKSKYGRNNVWSFDGKIFVKSDNETFRIHCFTDLQ